MERYLGNRCLSQSAKAAKTDTRTFVAGKGQNRPLERGKGRSNLWKHPGGVMVVSPRWHDTELAVQPVPLRNSRDRPPTSRRRRFEPDPWLWPAAGRVWLEDQRCVVPGPGIPGHVAQVDRPLSYSPRTCEGILQYLETPAWREKVVAVEAGLSASRNDDDATKGGREDEDAET